MDEVRNYKVNKSHEIVLNKGDMYDLVKYFRCSPSTAAGYMGTLVGMHALDICDAMYLIMCYENPDDEDHLREWVKPFADMSELHALYHGEYEDVLWKKMVAAVPKKYWLLAKFIQEMEKSYPGIALASVPEMEERLSV